MRILTTLPDHEAFAARDIAALNLKGGKSK